MELKIKELLYDLDKYRSIVQYVNIAIYLLASKKFEYVNPAFEALAGYSLRELTTKDLTIEDLIVPEDRKLMEAMHVEREKSVSTGSWIEFKIATRYGEIKNVESVIVNIRVGREAKILGIMRDITERKRMEEIVKLSEQYYKGMFDNALDAILIFSPETEIVIDVNPSACKMYGFTKEEFEGLSLESISKDLTHGKLQVEETLIKGIFHNFETVQYRKDGSEMHLEINASVMNINNKQAILSINRDISERIKLEHELRHAVARAGHSLDGIIKAVSVILEKQDPYTAGHHRRVANLAYAIAKKMGLPEDHAEGIKTAALIHDIGKINIPAEILTKPGTLNEYEFNVIKTHPRAAYDILKDIEFPWPIAEILYQHHEKFDGSGYPIGLKGDQIKLEARILMVANVVEAMTSVRSYRPALGVSKALEEIATNRNKFYDSKVVDACAVLFTQENYKL